VTYLPLEKETGLINIEEFKKAIRPGETLMASIILVNNEIGVI